MAGLMRVLCSTCRWPAPCIIYSRVNSGDGGSWFSAYCHASVASALTRPPEQLAPSPKKEEEEVEEWFSEEEYVEEEEESSEENEFEPEPEDSEERLSVDKQSRVSKIVCGCASAVV